VQLVSQVAVCLFALLPQLSGGLLEDPGESLQLRGQSADGTRAALLFGVQPSRHLLDLGADVLFQRREALFEVVT